MFRCVYCDVTVPTNGRLGHTRAKAHLAASDGDQNFDTCYESADSAPESGFAETVEVSPDALTPTIDDAIVEDRLAALEAELEAERSARQSAEERIGELLAENDEIRADSDVTHLLFESIDDVAGAFTDEQIREIAAQELAELNRGRLLRGFQPIEWGPEQWQEATDKVRADLVADRGGHVPGQGPLTRVIKLVNPNTRGLVQTVMEDQVNNFKGSLADPIERYRRKGFKVAMVRVSFASDGRMVVDPDGTLKTTLCPSKDCWDPALIDRGGNYVHGGYCAESHRRRTEPDPDGAGVADRRVLSGR